MTNNELKELQIVKKWKASVMPSLSVTYPYLTVEELDKALDYSVEKRLKDTAVQLDNTYKKKTIETTLMQMSEYIYKKEPIITPYGVLFRKHGEVNNPIAKMLQTFMANRNIFKDKMFTYPKGSEMFEKYNLMQGLAKVDANALYGAMGAPTSIFYNLYTAASITSAGQLSTAIAAIVFEGMLANNAKFRSLEEILTFMTNVREETRQFDCLSVLDSNIDIVDCFEHLILTCGHGWIPDERDLDIVWDQLTKLPQADLNRLFYKNNLFAFFNNESVKKGMVYILQKMDYPYLNPNKAPEIIKPELDGMWELVEEFVFYNHGIVDPIERAKFLPRTVTALMDTDSTMIHLDPWYHFILDQIKGVPMRIKTEIIKPVEWLEDDEFGDIIPTHPVEFIEQKYDYDFYSDEVIELERSVNPVDIIPQDGLRFSIANILAYMLDKAINSAMLRYTKSAFSFKEGKKCMMIMKNEYLMKRMLLTDSKRNYASILELQEGVNVGNMLDVKGLSITKSTLNEKSQKALKRILAEDILKAENVDQIKVLKELIIMEKMIIKSLQEGNKEYYKPVAIKSLGSYDKPMSIMGIKAAHVWNELRTSDYEAIDLTKRNAVDVVKVDINPKNIAELETSNPALHKGIMKLLTEKVFAGGITTIAVPLGVTPPEWIREFIDYKAIVNDVLKNFNKPLDSIGLQMISGHINYTNILQL